MANQTEIENALQWVFGDDDSEYVLLLELFLFAHARRQEKKAVVWGQLFEHFKMSPVCITFFRHLVAHRTGGMEVLRDEAVRVAQ